MIVAEVITGLWIGWLARLLVLALPVAGQFIAYMLGIANVLQPDPELGGRQRRSRGCSPSRPRSPF